MRDIENSIKNLKIWKHQISLEIIKGGMTNQNFIVTDGSKEYFVRIGKNIAEHLIFRENEIATSNAAALAGVAPKLVYTEEGIIVFEYIESRTYDSELVIKKIDKIIKVIKNIHEKIPNYLSGSPPLFWVFYVIKHYANFLKYNKSPYLNLLDEFLNKSYQMNKIASPYDIVFCHNDFLAANLFYENSKLPKTFKKKRFTLKAS